MHQRRACQRYEEEKWRTIGNSSVTAWSYHDQAASVSSCLPVFYVTWAGHVFAGVKLTFPKACPGKLRFLTCLFSSVFWACRKWIIVSIICPMPTSLCCQLLVNADHLALCISPARRTWIQLTRLFHTMLEISDSVSIYIYIICVHYNNRNQDRSSWFCCYQDNAASLWKVLWENSLNNFWGESQPLGLENY